MIPVNSQEKHKLVLAIDPSPRGFGYALFESPKKPLDWGVTDIRIQTARRSEQRIMKLINFYQPEVIVLEDCSKDKSRRCIRVKNLISEILKFAQLKKIQTKTYSRNRIQEVFSLLGARNKHEIAKEICDFLPEFEPRRPSRRKIWMSEDNRMNIFDAVSMVLAYYYLEG